jgi:peptide/nickel transport system substrate-binding protein
MSSSETRMLSGLSRRRLLQGAGAGAAAMLPIGAGRFGLTHAHAQESTPPSDVTPAAEQIVHYAWDADTRSIDPANAFESQSFNVVRAAYEGLVAQVFGTADLKPALATEWTISDDARVYTFTLRPDVLFHDGTSLDATAVKKSFDRVMAMNLGPATLLTTVESVNVVDDLTVEIVLNEPHAYFMAYVPKIGIVSPAAWEGNQVDDDFGAAYLEQNTVGTGPYTLTELRPNERKVMERFADYWQGWDGNHLERIIFSVVPQDATKRQMLEAGEIHYAASLPPEDLQALADSPNVSVVVSENFEIDIIPLNMRKPPLDDVRVRRALILAFDYAGYQESVLLGNGRLPTGPIAPGYPTFNEALPAFTQDLEQARALIEEAGATGATLQMNFLDVNSSEEAAALIMQDAASQIGLNVELIPAPWSTMFQLASSEETAHHMSILLMSTFTADPTFTLNQNYGCDFVGKPYNWSWGCSEEAQAKIDEAQRTLDEEKRTTLLQEAQQIIVDLAPAVFYANPLAVEAVSAKVQNYQWNPLDYYWQVDWYNIWLAE